MGTIQTAGLPQQPIVIPKPLGAGVVTDIRDFPKFLCYAGTFGFKTSTSTYYQLSSASPNDWVYANVSGSAAETTVCSLTGSGVVTHIKTPYTNIYTLALTVVVDDKTYKFTASSYYQIMFGAVLQVGIVETSNSTTFNSNNLPKLGGPYDTGHQPKVSEWLFENTTNGILVPSVVQTIQLGLPRLRFERNFKVSMRPSGVYSSGTHQDYGAVGYQLDQ